MEGAEGGPLRCCLLWVVVTVCCRQFTSSIVDCGRWETHTGHTAPPLANHRPTASVWMLQNCSWSLASTPCNHGVAYHIPHPLHPPDTTQPHTPTIDQSLTSASSSRHPACLLSEVYPVLCLDLDRSSLRLSERHRRVPTRQPKSAKGRRKQSRRVVLRAFCVCAPTSPTHSQSVA